MTKMALIYDFDKTLSPKDMQEFHLIQRLGFKDTDAFWKRCNELSVSTNMDGILSYMYNIAKEDPSITKDDLYSEGSYVEYFKGVDTWFDRVNEYGRSKGIEIEHYIISSGLKEIILGTSIAKEFKKIYACSYYYDEDGTVKWPARVVNYTTKTQYIFRINKGVLDETNDIDLNRSTPDEDKYIPYDRMIYFGDGLTDVPSMKVVTGFGGTSIAVYGQDAKDRTAQNLAKELYEDKRATFMARADYSKDSKIEKIVFGIIDHVATDVLLNEYRD